MASVKVLPAYARQIRLQLIRGNHPAAIGVLFSSRWWHFDHVPKICLRPDEWALGRFEFGYLKGEHVVAIWGEEIEEIQFGELLIELMLAGPRRLWICGLDGRWIQRATIAFEVRLYADQLTGYKRRDLTERAEAAMMRAEARETELLQAEVQRAIDLDRQNVPFVLQRNAAEKIVEQRFTDTYPPGDERAA